ncbi:hypothetical protein PN36_02520 [Candidatus Thiomargarita nelsonii]|uniref:Uncharacterized protein n=1 Tax=Candidatus Thiomargarita nelsonii TaxID=1003181 RepID=A0A4E0QT51_9GAMM|nr:hypothetical protein PN36_02520 [Candidatus Thiomargarita nelsonii]
MDSDDLSSLNKLQLQSAILEETDIVYSPWVRGYFRKKVFEPEDVVLQQQALPTVKDMLTCFLTDWSIIFQQCLFRRVFLKNVGFYREDMRLHSRVFCPFIAGRAKSGFYKKCPDSLLFGKPGRHPVLGHWRFRLNVWRALRDMLDWLDKKWGGFRQRLYGHRWPSSYQAGPLTEQQKSLIREIGYFI